jgi:hypothetical protein
MIEYSGTSKPSLIGRESMVLASMAALLFAVTLVRVINASGYNSVLHSDAQHYYRVATDPFGTGSVFHGTPPGVGTAYRYGRILYPFMAWVVALGNPPWVRYALPLVHLCGVWLVFALACEFCALAGRRAAYGLGIVFLPSVLLYGLVLVPEMLISGLILLVYRFALANRPRDAKIATAVLLLARETAVLAIIPLGLRCVMRRRYASALGWAATLIPLALWWTWVRIRIGIWPFLDPVNAYNKPLDLPIRGFLAMAWHPTSIAWLAARTAWITIALALLAHKMFRWFPLTAGAIWTAMLMVFFGPGQANLPGEAFRLMMPTQILVALGFLAAKRSRPDLNSNTEETW